MPNSSFERGIQVTIYNLASLSFLHIRQSRVYQLIPAFHRHLPPRMFKFQQVSHVSSCGESKLSWSSTLEEPTKPSDPCFPVRQLTSWKTVLKRNVNQQVYPAAFCFTKLGSTVPRPSSPPQVSILTPCYARTMKCWTMIRCFMTSMLLHRY